MHDHKCVTSSVFMIMTLLTNAMPACKETQLLMGNVQGIGKHNSKAESVI